MKRKIFLTCSFFLLVCVFVKGYDLTQRYDVTLGEYIRYSLPLSASEEAYLANNTVHYGIDVNDAPYVLVSEDTNQNSGIMVDYFNQLSVTLESVFEPVVTDDYNTAIQLKNGKMDASVLNRTKINNDVFLFTQTLYKERCKILVDGESKFDSINDVNNISIAVVSGSTAHHAANTFFKKEKNIHLVLAENLEETFSLLESGTVDAIIGDEAKVAYLLNHDLRTRRYKFLQGAVSEEDVAVAVNKNRSDLLTILNKGILEMKKIISTII